MIDGLRRFARRSCCHRPAARGRFDAGGEPYASWLERHIRGRRDDHASPGFADSLSVLTCVYEGSPADLLKATAGSVLSQTDGHYEWLLLCNGPLRPDQEAVVRAAASEPRVRVLRTAKNDGIIAGLRHCLDAASSDYVMPLDADDLLTDDCVQQVRWALERYGKPAFLYGDEDGWADGASRNPYLRPAWDPLLNLSSSYIWHPSVFHRETALELDVFSDPRSEYCQDWDTVGRFARAGIEPVHVPKILYHWRAHEASSTNRPDRHRGSLESQRHVLDLWRKELARPDHFTVAEYPLFRGLPEPWLRRSHDEPAAVDWITLGSMERRDSLAALDSPSQTVPLLDQASAGGSPAYPFSGTFRVDPATGVRGLRAVLLRSSAEHVLVIDQRLAPLGEDWAWEAVGILELLPAVMCVGGRVVNNDAIVTGELLAEAEGRVSCPDAGRSVHDPGYYAHLLKPHLVDGVSGHFFFARRSWLAQALSRLPDTATLGFLGAWLGAIVASDGGTVACSPLVAAGVRGAWDGAERADAGEIGAYVRMLPATTGESRRHWRLQCSVLGERRPLPPPW